MEVKEEEIHMLFCEKVAGVISAINNTRIDRAIETDEGIRRRWEEFQTEIDLPRLNKFLAKADVAEGWQKVQTQLARQQTQQSRIIPMRRWVTVAAATVGFAILAAVLLYSRPHPGAPPVLIGRNQQDLVLKLASGKEIKINKQDSRTIQEEGLYVAIRGERLTYEQATKNSENEWGTLMVPAKLDYKLTLPDGTEVWLNSLSSLRFPYSFSGNTREVYLSGEAYLKVAKNKNKPFIVHTEKTDIRVLGTIFNVNAYDTNNISTALIEGSVQASSGSKNILLRPGYQAVFSDGVFNAGTFDEAEVTAWMDGLSYFHNTRLSLIAELLPRWFGVKVVFDNPQTQTETFTGAINKNKPLKVFLTNIYTSAGINAYLKADELHFR